jgi:tellurite resistance protein TerC
VETTIGFPPLTMAVFVGLALGALLLDMVTHRDDKPITLAGASIWSCSGWRFRWRLPLPLRAARAEVASLFVTGYALEKVLSVDNLFVFMAIFAWFKVPDGLRHRILYWGIIGAIVFRGVFVAIGTGLLAFGPWVEIVFALIVAWTAVMMLKAAVTMKKRRTTPSSPTASPKAVPCMAQAVWPQLLRQPQEARSRSAEAENKGMSLAAKGGLFATPLFLCLVVVEVSDVLFAFDSVPAVIAVSREPLIVYSAMLFAILGLRTLYFVLEALKRYLVHLEKAVIVLLFFIAAKLGLNATDHLFHHGISIDPNTSLIIVLAVLASASWPVSFPEKEEPRPNTLTQ